MRTEKEALKAKLSKAPQMKALKGENDELRAMNASLADQLRGHAGKKVMKKKVPKNSTAKDDWGDLENCDPADAILFLEEEGDYIWFSDFLNTPISFTPEL